MRVRENGRGYPRMIAEAIAQRLPRAEATAAAIVAVEKSLRQHRRDGGRTRRQVLSDEHAAILAVAAQSWLDIAYVIPNQMNPDDGYPQPTSYYNVVSAVRRVWETGQEEALNLVRRACDTLGIIPHFARPRRDRWQLCLTAGERRQVWFTLGMPEGVNEDAEH